MMGGGDVDWNDDPSMDLEFSDYDEDAESLADEQDQKVYEECETIARTFEASPQARNDRNTLIESVKNIEGKYPLLQGACHRIGSQKLKTYTILKVFDDIVAMDFLGGREEWAAQYYDVVTQWGNNTPLDQIRDYIRRVPSEHDAGFHTPRR